MTTTTHKPIDTARSGRLKATVWSNGTDPDDPAALKTIPLPAAPSTASPVPHLTSIHSVVERGPYGVSRYRGNCGGYLIRDLLAYFQPKRVLDPMTGGGT